MKQTTINREHKKELAELFGVSEDYVSKVIRGKRANKAITDAYNLYSDLGKKAARTAKTKVTKKLNPAA